MREYAIITDSNCELTPDYIEKHNLVVIPMPFEIDGKGYLNYPDYRDLTPHDFYDMLRGGKTASTSQLNSAIFIDFFEEELKNGRDVIYIGFSGGLSGTYYQSTLAAEEMREKYPDAKIYTIDTLGASLGQGLLVLNAAVKRSEGISIDAVFHWVEETRYKVCHWFTVDDLNHLKRGGRISPAAALVGTMLGIKPILNINDEGKLIPITKVRGRQKAIEALVEEFAKAAVNPEEQIIYISHADSIEDAEKVRDLIKAKYPVKDFVMTTVGPVIGSHSGPGTLAV
ncbi:MAG: fatty acid-binding protein DegV, partial [Clostridiales bacterium 43-6]